MDFYIDESGNTGDLALTNAALDFGGQAVFCLAAIGSDDESFLKKEIDALRRKHRVQAAELKLSKILKRKPQFALDVVKLLTNNSLPFFIEIVDKKYQLAVNINNNFFWPPYLDTPDTRDDVELKKATADYIYDEIPDAVIYAFVQCMNDPSNEKIDAYFNLLHAAVSQGSGMFAEELPSVLEVSKDDFRIIIEEEGDKAYRRFLPLPDIGKRKQQVWMLPNFSSFTNIYARINLYLSGNLEGSRIFHDEQAHFDAIIADAKLQAESVKIDSKRFMSPYSDYDFQQMADLSFETSSESTGIQVSDIIAGLSMRWYQAHLQEESDTRFLDEAIDLLLRHSDSKRGTGINIVGRPLRMPNSVLTEAAVITLHDIPEQLQDKLIAFHVNAESATGRTGGFGGEVVFLDNGVHVRPRLLAAKYPRKKSDQSPRESAEAFLREITLQAKAHYHPNVHWPFEVVMIQNVPVAYFRRWEGDLSAFIEDEQLSDEGRLSILVQLVAGLAHCQTRGLVHQDLKPENVFVRDLRKDFELPEGDVWYRPLVADFGSVNLAADIGVFRGSRPYMAPEQWSETILTEKTNVFAVGIMLHELMTRGEHPIGTHGGDWHKRINPGFNRWQDNDRWRAWVKRGCPIANPLPNADLAAIVEECLAVEPAARPSLNDLRDRLLGALSARSNFAETQVKLLLSAAEYETEEKEWLHLKSLLNRLSRAIDEHFLPDPGRS